MQYASDLALAVAPPPAALPLRWQAPPPPAGSPRPPHTSRPSIQRPCSGPRLTMPHPTLPGIVPRPLHTAPSPALDAAGHQPSSPPPPPPPFPRRASGHPVVPVRWAYLLVSSPERAHTHTLSVTSPAMSCNVQVSRISVVGLTYLAKSSLSVAVSRSMHDKYVRITKPHHSAKWLQHTSTVSGVICQKADFRTFLPWSAHSAWHRP